MSKLLVAVMAATVFTMVGAALLATAQHRALPRIGSLVVEGPRSTHFKTSDKIMGPAGGRPPSLAGDRGRQRRSQAATVLVDTSE